MEKVEIVVTAKDSASQVLRGISSSFGGIGSAIQMLTAGGAIEALTTELVKFGKESVDATVAYADEVRRLSQISGDSAEETSRLIQLADDYKISTGDLTVAMRKLTSEGLSLNVQTLAKLSDEYLKLNPGQERAAFLMQNFGRQGVKFAEIMGKGSAAIIALNDGIDENLILTDKAVKQAREYEMAMDAWEEQTLKLQYAFGTQLLPTLTNGIDMVNEKINDQGLALGVLSIGWDDVFAAVMKQPEAVDSATLSYTAMAEAVERNSAAAEEATTDFDGLLSMTEQLAGANEEATRKIVYNNLLQKLSVDGITDAEFAMANQVGVTLGIFDQKAVNSAALMDDLTQAVIDGRLSTDELGNAIRMLPSGKTIDVIVNTINKGWDTLQREPGERRGSNRASGGSVGAGEWYRVNETNQEYFRANTNGTVLPIGPGGGGSGVTVVVNTNTVVGDRAHLESYLLPVIREGLRQVGAGR
jgi:hypothetical protein